MATIGQDRNWANSARFKAGTGTGHYESWFVRANHPNRPRAFWLRYTVFSPKGRPEDAVGELWAIWFDAERGRIAAAKEIVPLSVCSFATGGLDVRIGEARLTDTFVEGSATTPDHSLQWALDSGGGGAPLLLLPHALYDRRFPKAKALVGSTNVQFSGAFAVDGEAESIEGWQGSQNHNWGSAHTDSYAWGQVCGFDEDESIFLECSTARLRFGSFWTPPMSFVVLRTDEQEYRWNSIWMSLRAKGTWDYFDWRVSTGTPKSRIDVRFHAPRVAFVGLTYSNPPGWTKTCLNSKIASCEVTLERRGNGPRSFTATARAAFEILTDRADHMVPVVL